MNVRERLEEDGQNQIDRRNLSAPSKRRLSEAIYNGDVEMFEAEVFHILTGDVISEWEPWRDVEGKLTATDEVLESIEDNEWMRVIIGMGDDTVTRPVQESGDYQFRGLTGGEYTLTVESGALITEDPETLETTHQDITLTVEIEDETVVVDTEATEIAPIEGPEIKVINYE